MLSPCFISALPGPPVIYGYEDKPVSPGSTVSLVCISNGTQPDARLTWYRAGRQVDITYSVQGSQIINEYEFTADAGRFDQLNVTCRLEYRPAKLVLIDSILIRMQGEFLQLASGCGWRNTNLCTNSCCH